MLKCTFWAKFRIRFDNSPIYTATDSITTYVHMQIPTAAESCQGAFSLYIHLIISENAHKVQCSQM